ncbi:MAG: 50S ribosomal protein L28 [Deltaproteobacteria bacterium]|nr:50S ribosomal protein L28 [Deltaproteobacteria bacterium]
MAYRCEICGKGAQRANNVSHSNRKTRKWQEPNLQRVHALIDGHPKRIWVCTRCIRSNRIVKAAPARVALAA